MTRSNNTISVWFQVSIKVNGGKNGSEFFKGTNMASNAYFAPNQKGHQKLVTKLHQHTVCKIKHFF